MSFYEDEYYDDYPRRRGGLGRSIGMKILKLIGIILCLPAVIVGGLQFYILFARGRLRLYIISLINIIELLIFIPIMMKIDPISTMIESFSFRSGVEWGPLLLSYLLICILIGIIGGWVFTAVKVRQFKIMPSILMMNGWTYKFQYRTTPWEIYKERALIKELKDGKQLGYDPSPIGVLQEKPRLQVEEIDVNRELLIPTDKEIISRSYADALKHTLITGGTGAGKTMTMLALIKNDVEMGIPVCVIDFKKSATMLDKLSALAREYDRPFYYFSNGDDPANNTELFNGKATFDPFDSGDQNSRTETILDLREWDSAAAVYKDQTKNLLISINYALLNVNQADVPNIPWHRGGLHRVLAALDLVNMKELLIGLNRQFEIDAENGTPPSETDIDRLNTLKTTYNLLVMKGADGKKLREQLEGLRLTCSNLIMSSYGNWLTTTHDGNHIDMYDIMTSEKAPIVLFAFSENEESEYAKSLGTITFNEIKKAATKKETSVYDNMFGLYVDEAQTVDPEVYSGIFEKARSAKIFATLSVQSMEQISAESDRDGEAVLKALLDTCNNFIIHAGATHDTAERLSKIVGETNYKNTRLGEEEINKSMFNLQLTTNLTGRPMTEITRDWVIPPSQFSKLAIPSKENGYKSEAYYITNFKVGDRKKRDTLKGAKKVRVVPPSDVVAPTSEEYLEYERIQEEESYNRQQRLKENKKLQVTQESLQEEEWEIERSDGSLSEGFRDIREDKYESQLPPSPEIEYSVPVNKNTESKTTSKPSGLPNLKNIKLPNIKKPNVNKVSEENKTTDLPKSSTIKKKSKVMTMEDINNAPLSRD